MIILTIACPLHWKYFDSFSICVNFIFRFILFFFVAGPELSIFDRGLRDHEMVNIGKDLIIMGDVGAGGPPDKIFKLACSNRVCNWEKLEAKLYEPRSKFTAITIPDDFIDCN